MRHGNLVYVMILKIDRIICLPLHRKGSIERQPMLTSITPPPPCCGATKLANQAVLAVGRPLTIGEINCELANRKGLRMPPPIHSGHQTVTPSSNAGVVLHC